MVRANVVQPTANSTSSLIVIALISLDAIVLRSFCSLHNINLGCRAKAAPGNLQNLIHWTRVVFDQDFLPAR